MLLDAAEQVCIRLQVLGSQGKYEEAEGIYRQTLALREPVLGKKHPTTLTSMNNLALVLDNQGKSYLLHQNKQYKDAELFYDRACAGYKNMLGDSHPTTTACLRHYSLMRKEENSNR